MSISESYNSWAASYDTNQNKTRDLDKVVSQKVLEAYSYDLILELGCGTGKNTEWLLEKTKSMIAFDFSEEMLAIAKEKIKSDQVQFRQADLNQDWNLDPQIADLICCNLVLEHIANLDAIFQQAARTLKPGGHFFLCELHSFKQYAGSQAKFETADGAKELEVYVHDVSEYLGCAKQNGFQLLELNEWWDEPREKHAIPRLISFLFADQNQSLPHSST